MEAVATRVKVLGVALAMLLIVMIVMPAPALAAGSKQGTKSCPPGQVALRGETTGTTRFYVPNDATFDKTANHGMFLQASYYVSGYASNTWKVSTNMVLYVPGTYAYCAGI